MSTFWKVMLGLALVLPMSAYVVGSLLASSGGEPGPRDPIIIQDATTSPTAEPTAGPEPSRKPSPREPRNRGGDDRDDVDDNGVRIVTPEPTRVGGDDDDTGDDDSADDDDSDNDRGDDDADDGDDDGGDD